MEKKPPQTTVGDSSPIHESRFDRSSESTFNVWEEYAKRLETMGRALLETVPSGIDDSSFIEYEVTLHEISVDMYNKKIHKGTRDRINAVLNVMTGYAADMKKKGNVAKRGNFASQMKAVGEELSKLADIVRGIPK